MPAQEVDLAFRNNQNWFLLLDVSGWQAIYDLAAGTFRMQARSTAATVVPLYSWSSEAGEGARGSINLVPGGATALGKTFLAVTATYADVVRYLQPGSYSYDLQWALDNPSPGFVEEVLAYGSLTVAQGYTRS